MIEVKEHRLSLLEQKRFLREFNKKYPKPEKRWPLWWWVPAGVAFWVIVGVML